MKKLERGIFIFLTCIIATLPLSSCNINKDCQHKWSNYIAKYPTCEDSGILEMNCNKCGEKKYEEILSSGHSYKNDVCTICGEKKEDNASENATFTKIPLPENSDNSAKWTFQNIIDTINLFNSNNPYTHEEFFETLSKGYIQDSYVDSLDLLHLNAIENNVANDKQPLEISLVLPIKHVSPENPSKAKFTNIHRIESKNGDMWITYVDGLQISVGKFHSTDQEAVIEAFGVNKDNELIIYYTDNTIAFVGKIVEGTSQKNQSGFLYHQVENGYSINKALDIEAENIDIPLTHRGKPIVRIESFAFKKLENVKTITLGANVEYVEEDVFNVPSLQYVIIPDCEMTIANPSDYPKYGNVKFFFEGEREKYVASGNDFPLENFFFKGDWIYVNGVPRGFAS